MRLLYLTAETWPTFRADVAALFGKYLPRHGIHSDLVAGRTPGHAGPAEWGGGEALLCDVSGGQAKKHLKVLLHGIRHLLGANRRCYDAIQVRDMPVLAAFGLLTARFKGLPFYYWMSYPIPEGHLSLARRGDSAGLGKSLYHWTTGHIGRCCLYRLILPFANHVFVQSDRMKQEMIERRYDANKMTPVPMGVDLEEMCPEDILPEEDARLAGRRVIVYLGTFDPTRRLEVLFDMLVQVRIKIPEALLILVGDTQDAVHRAWLKRQAEKAGVAEHVIWTGWLPMHQGWRYVRAAEVGLSPIPRGPLLDVGSPTKVPEYLVLGVPVVCNDNPDQLAIIKQSGSGLCVPYTAEDFAKAAIALMNQDRAVLSRNIQDGRIYVRNTRSYCLLASELAKLYTNK